MKVRLPIKKIILMWLLVFVIGLAAVVLSFFNLFFLTPFGSSQIIVLVVYTLILVLILFLSINGYYYEINKKDITVCKFGKKYSYFYSDIIYIDEEQSMKSKTLCFVTKYGHVKYLTFDKEGKIFDAVKVKCHNLKTLEEVKRLFPGVKI